jgi:hypothetical protein
MGWVQGTTAVQRVILAFLGALFCSHLSCIFFLGGCPAAMDNCACIPNKHICCAHMHAHVLPAGVQECSYKAKDGKSGGGGDDDDPEDPDWGPLTVQASGGGRLSSLTAAAIGGWCACRYIYMHWHTYSNCEREFWH